MRGVRESDGEYARRVTIYKNLLKGVAFFSNGDTITSVASGATQTFAGGEALVDYKYSGGASIAASAIALLIIGAMCIKRWCIDTEERQRPVSLPTTYLIFLFISCILSIVGNTLLIADQNLNPGKKKPDETDLHIAGAILFALAKVINPAFASTLVVADSLEQNAANQANAGDVSPQIPGDPPPPNPKGNNLPPNPKGNNPPPRDTNKLQQLKREGYIDSATTFDEKKSLVEEENKELDDVVSAEVGTRRGFSKNNNRN